MKINFPPSSQAIKISREHKRSTNVHMFQEDIVLSIMPMGAESTNFLSFDAKFVGEKLENNNAIAVCKSLGRNSYRHDESNVICQCIEDIARSLAWDGAAIYEILFNAETKKLHFLGVSTTGIYEVPFGLIQIPTKFDKCKKRFNFLNSKNIWKIEMPPLLGEKNGYRKILSNLSKFNSLGPVFYMQGLEKGVLTKSFEYADYRQKSHIFARKSTLNWGWDLRDIDREEKTEIYQYYQDLTFSWAKAVLREHIISELNILFKKLEIKSIIEVSGIPTPKEILKFREDLLKGNKSFDDVLKFIFY